MIDKTTVIAIAAAAIGALASILVTAQWWRTRPRVRRYWRGTMLVVEPRGYLIGGEETDEFTRVLRKVIREGAKDVVVDLARVEHLNSTAIGALIESHGLAIEAGGKLRLAHVSDRIQNIFIITKLAHVFEYADRVEGTARQ